MLSTFAAAHRQVDLTLQTGTTCELLEQVLDHRVEGAFVCGPVAHSALEAERAFVEELVLLTAAPIGSLDALTESGDLRIAYQPPRTCQSPPSSGSHLQNRWL